MKSVTEFANFTLVQGLKNKSTLAAEGKSPEEIQEALGQTFKFEGDKLKFFVSALDVAAANTENLKRVRVMSLAEGENVPPKAAKVEEHYFVPEFHQLARPAPAAKEERGRGGRRDKGGKGGKGGGKDGRGEGKPKASAGGAPSRPIPKT